MIIIKKIVLPSLVAGIVMVVTNMIVGQIFHGLFPTLILEYNNPSLFRPWSDPIMSLFLLYPFILAIILVIVWEKVDKLISGKTHAEKALRFGTTYWLLTSITGMLISYSTFPVSLLMIFSWSISSLITVIAGVYIIVWMKK
ncbi:hypothetical protein A2Y99_05280 [Candidatus Gottesmanbacteria bacterium RBG_13_37_7]|uniref:Uncharacterized protein n=1 Tax=Candidatus Gottesmanbacteria bacterium RBG_13_37_7 TaxID=1798369 RepID=A0A1F5YL67_9BACT|nr:MAG: hypothetical protein A2Y99_05280 [Candidatus Gottesmanbacteria bacterium RBG_13_37_7]